MNQFRKIKITPYDFYYSDVAHVVITEKKIKKMWYPLRLINNLPNLSRPIFLSDRFFLYYYNNSKRETKYSGTQDLIVCFIPVNENFYNSILLMGLFISGKYNFHTSEHRGLCKMVIKYSSGREFADKIINNDDKTITRTINFFLDGVKAIEDIQKINNPDKIKAEIAIFRTKYSLKSQQFVNWCTKI